MSHDVASIELLEQDLKDGRTVSLSTLLLTEGLSEEELVSELSATKLDLYMLAAVVTDDSVTYVMRYKTREINDEAGRAHVESELYMSKVEHNVL